MTGVFKTGGIFFVFVFVGFFCEKRKHTSLDEICGGAYLYQKGRTKIDLLKDRLQISLLISSKFK